MILRIKKMKTKLLHRKSTTIPGTDTKEQFSLMGHDKKLVLRY